jgi:hypothetical protein
MHAFATPADSSRQDCSPTEDYAYAANVWAFSLVQGPFLKPRAKP